MVKSGFLYKDITLSDGH